MIFGEAGDCGARSVDIGGRTMHWEGILCMCFVDKGFCPARTSYMRLVDCSDGFAHGKSITTPKKTKMRTLHMHGTITVKRSNYNGMHAIIDRIGQFVVVNIVAAP